MEPYTQQLPEPGKINVDHIAHYVPDIEAASAALVNLGFTVTPFSLQSHRLDAGAPLVPAGTGNRCVVFKTGYLEFVTPTGDTPLAGQLRAAMERYVGVHMIAFGTATPDADYARLAKGGFQPLPPVALQREIETPTETDTVRFTVVRVAPGVMPEGRIQYCRHETPHLVWQTRWLEHANGAEALTSVLVCVENPEQTAQRYGRYTGLAPEPSGAAWRLETARGDLLFIDSGQCRRSLGVEPPALPWIAGSVLATASLAPIRALAAAAGIAARDIGNGRCLIELPPSVGGLLVFEPLDSMRAAFP